MPKDTEPQITADEIADSILKTQFAEIVGEEEVYILRHWRGSFYLWSEGLYKELNDSQVEMAIVRWLQEYNARKASDEEKISISSSKVSNTLLCLGGRCFLESDTEINTWLDGVSRGPVSNVLNGIVNYGVKKDGNCILTEHDPRFFSNIQLQTPYKPARDCPCWKGFLSDVTCQRQELSRLLQQWCGYLLCGDLSAQRLLMLVGDGANGKSVYLEVITAMLGSRNVSQIPLSLFGSQFGLSGTVGKMANITSESHHVVGEEAESILKAIVAGDSMMVQRKFKEPVQVTPTAKVMIATNSLPRFSDKTGGIWRRILIVPFDKIFSQAEQIPTMAQELKKELPGILNWAMVGREDYLKNGFISPRESSEMLDNYRRDADPARAFLLDNYEESSEDRVVCQEMYDLYTSYCKANGFGAINSANLGRQVKYLAVK